MRLGEKVLGHLFSDPKRKSASISDSNMSLSARAAETIKSCAPLLRSCGTEVTGRMYRTTFADHPEFRGLFNMSDLRHLTDNNVGPECSLQVRIYTYYVLLACPVADSKCVIPDRTFLCENYAQPILLADPQKGVLKHDS